MYCSTAPLKRFLHSSNFHYMQLSSNKIMLLRDPRMRGLALSLPGAVDLQVLGLLLQQNACASPTAPAASCSFGETVCRFQSRWFSTTVYQQTYPLYRCTCCFSGLLGGILLKNERTFCQAENSPALI